MKYQAKLTLFIFSILFYSCSPKISTSLKNSYAPIDYAEDIVVLGVDDHIPSDSEILGEIKIGDTGFSTNCDYNTVIELAKLEARKVGGNALKITDHKLPSIMGSSCHRITAEILKVADIDKIAEIIQIEEVDPNVDYATLYIYRYGGMGALVGFDLHLGDKAICRVVNNFKTIIETKELGGNVIWAKTESKAELPVNLKAGGQYYIRCSIGMGAFVGRPKLELMDAKVGKSEFNSFNAKNR